MANQYGFFFTRDNLVIRLPINPDSFPVSRENNNSTYNVLGIGDVTVPRIPKQKTISISSFFPGRPAPYALNTGGFKPPEFYINFFQSAMDDGVPILFTPVRYYENGEPFMTGDTGFPVLVSSFETEEKGGETGDFYYSLELTEWRDFSPQVLVIEKPEEEKEEETKASEEKTRDIPPAQLYVGCKVKASGNYYVSSYGDEPHGTVNGKICKVSIIITTDPKRAYPIHITTESGGALGWIKKGNLQVLKG